MSAEVGAQQWPLPVHHGARPALRKHPRQASREIKKPRGFWKPARPDSFIRSAIRLHRAILALDHAFIRAGLAARIRSIRLRIR